MNPIQKPDPMNQAKDPKERVKEEAIEKSQQVIEMARETTMDTLGQQKGRAAESLGSVASALRQAGEQLGSHDQQMIGRVANQAADRLEHFSTGLQDKSVEDLMGDAERFARREPEMFLGGAVVLGLLAARFLKSSQNRRRQGQMASGVYPYGGATTYSTHNPSPSSNYPARNVPGLERRQGYDVTYSNPGPTTSAPSTFSGRTYTADEPALRGTPLASKPGTPDQPGTTRKDS